jgi:hypothetical protein
MPAIYKGGGVSRSVRSSSNTYGQTPTTRQLNQSDIAREWDIAQQHFSLYMSGMIIEVLSIICTYFMRLGLNDKSQRLISKH